MQRGLGGFPHERLHQDGNREQKRGNTEQETGELGSDGLLAFWPRYANGHATRLTYGHATRTH
ncbi:hypothetical protein [Moorena sp. SIO3H5]|uniref:hypothetical protein n=1 Tax=Moorena sp. SIO3H5 TaxID=2607834 RepID=UPI0013BE8066|nr:hypothetical protein [Moorena sp. SIO3H5]NEO73962.1 hypothetical protein [Moorena sp. SIO3H5]